jgi:hypothetical protein
VKKLKNYFKIEIRVGKGNIFRLYARQILLKRKAVKNQRKERRLKKKENKK